jgi:hypothetical protein
LSTSVKAKPESLSLRKIFRSFHNLLRHIAGSTDFRLIRAEGGAFLAFAKPTKRTTIFENDTATHTPEIEEREESSVGHCTANLRAPACITVGGESRHVVGCWRSGISVSFDICGGGRIVDERMHWSNIIRDGGDTVVMR